jgi:hypothetical protein
MREGTPPAQVATEVRNEGSALGGGQTLACAAVFAWGSRPLSIRYVDIEDETPVIEQVPLSEPRSLTAKERALIDFLLAGPMGQAELRAQAETAQVVGVCSCGCPSVWIEVDPAMPPAHFGNDDAPYGPNGAVAITANQRKTKGSTEVTLHVVQGRLFELEVWTGGYGVKPRVDLARLEYENKRRRRSRLE